MDLSDIYNIFLVVSIIAGITFYLIGSAKRRKFERAVEEFCSRRGYSVIFSPQKLVLYRITGTELGYEWIMSCTKVKGTKGTEEKNQMIFETAGIVDSDLFVVTSSHIKIPQDKTQAIHILSSDTEKELSVYKKDLHRVVNGGYNEFRKHFLILCGGELKLLETGVDVVISECFGASRSFRLVVTPERMMFKVRSSKTVLEIDKAVEFGRHLIRTAKKI